MDQLDSNSLITSDILLLILVYLDSCQLIICRRVCRQFLEVIDHNQLLWRSFEWIQRDQESFRPAIIDMFDQKSGSTMEQISFNYRNNDEVAKHLMSTISRSKATLKQVSLIVHDPLRIQDQLLDLVSSSPSLQTLVAWDWFEMTYLFPLCRLLPVNQRLYKSTRQSQASQLKVLWIHNGVETIPKIDSKLFNSLISFSQSEDAESGPSYEMLSKFSETLVHLKIGIDLEDSIPKPLSCPNLLVFEGFFVERGLNSLLDAPKLQVLVLESVNRYDLTNIPVSVEEIWLRSRREDLFYSDWRRFLGLNCPRLKTLKLTKDFIAAEGCDEFWLANLLVALQDRKTLVDGNGEVKGIKIVSLKTLVLPTHLFGEDELDRARELVEEVVDVKDYRECIEIEY